MKNAMVRLMIAAAGVVAMGGWDVKAVEDLNGAEGNIFRVNPANRSFELLKETVFDPETGEGISRHAVYWNDQTRFTKVVRHLSFKDIKGRVLAEFYSLPAEKAAAIEAGEPFRSRFVKVFEHTEKKHGLSDDRQSLVGWFTADPASERHRDGVVEFSGKSVRVSLPGPEGMVEVFTAVDADAISTGFWGARIEGERVDGRFVAAHLWLHPKTDPREVDDPALPRVLVVGDSISMNYHESAKAELAGVANYYRVEGNAGPTGNGVARMAMWMGDYESEGLQWDVIQFNHGLHDLKQFYDKDSATYGAHLTDIDTYKANMEKEIAMMRKTGATLMWCSTTPVPNSSFGQFAEGVMGRQKDEDRVYNRAAMDVMARYPDILISDLNAVIRNGVETTDLFADWRKGTDVHFWHRPQQEFVGKAVASAVRRALEHRRGCGAAGAGEGASPLQ